MREVQVCRRYAPGVHLSEQTGLVLVRGADELGPLPGYLQHVGPRRYIGRAGCELVAGVAVGPPLGHAIGIAGNRIQVVFRPGASEAVCLGEGGTGGYAGRDGEVGIAGADKGGGEGREGICERAEEELVRIDEDE